jgi:hypothetical protein
MAGGPLNPDAVSSWLMQSTPHGAHNTNWPGYQRAKDYFDYLDRFPGAQSNPNPQLLPFQGYGVPTQGGGPDPWSATPLRLPDFHRGPNFWNTSF